MTHGDFIECPCNLPKRKMLRLSQDEITSRQTLPRRCSICKEIRPASEFYSIKHFWCKPCNRKKHKQYRESGDQNSLRTRRRKCHLKRTFGLTPLEYDLILKEQNGACAICERPPYETFRGRPRPLAVDHDHETGKIRGLLCAKCNFILGTVRDDVDILRNGILYLEKHSNKEEK